MSAAVADEDTGMPISEAADQLGIHPRTLRRYISDGRMVATRYTSQVVRIHQEDLDLFLENNIKMVTGVGTCYVPRLEPKPQPKSSGRVRKAAKPSARTW
jgi:excisionase family DNA binding protein